MNPTPEHPPESAEVDITHVADGIEAVEDGAALLDEVRAAITRYVILPGPHAAVALVLWVAATHAVPAFEHATRLAIHSATKRCGKTRLREVCELMVHSALPTTDISVAALVRIIDRDKERPPTLMLDEADRLFGSSKKDEDNASLIQLLNNGFRQGSPTWRCVGPQQTPTPFSNYAMAGVFGIGRKPDTIEDRAINITMRRRMPGETVAKFRLKSDQPALIQLRERIAAWAAINLSALEKPVNDMPDQLEDRQEDAWEPLLAVADVAGGHWPELARRAAVALCEDAANEDAESLEVRLLRDIRAVFDTMPHVGFLSTNVLLEQLRKIDDAPWRDLDLTGRKLALRLSRFEVKPRHNATKSERGYHLEDLLDAFGRYIRPDPSGLVQPNDFGVPGRTGHEPPDGSSVRADLNRPASKPGNPSLGHVRTGSDGSPPGQHETRLPATTTATNSDQRACRTCGRPQLEWVLTQRDGQCINCHRQPASPAAATRPHEERRATP
jgi:hypothetical protein